MTWLGKILTILVLLGNLVWAFFTVQAFATRTNWKTEADKYKDAFAKSEAARKDDLGRRVASEDALRRQISADQKQILDLSSQVGTLSAAANKNATDFAKLQDQLAKIDAQVIIYQANLANTIKELDGTRARSEKLENDRLALVLATEDAKREMIKARNEQKIDEAVARDLVKRVEDLQARMTDLRAGGGRGGFLFDKPPPPVLANLHGEVVQVAGDLVSLNLGIDAGVSKGTVLDVYRLEGGGKYLGTAKVTYVDPKKSVAVFSPSRGVPIAQLRPEELPKVGDEVRPPEGLTGGR